MPYILVPTSKSLPTSDFYKTKNQSRRTKKWQKTKEFYLVIKGEKIIVSEEVYRAYKSSDRAERKRKQRMWRCRIKREKGINNQWKRCQGNCEECQFKQQKMSDVSLDALKEEGFDGVVKAWM